MASGYSFAVVFVVWSLREDFNFFEHNRTQCEMMLLYLGALLAIFIAGAGRHILDALVKE